MQSHITSKGLGTICPCDMHACSWSLRTVDGYRLLQCCSIPQTLVLQETLYTLQKRSSALQHPASKPSPDQGIICYIVQRDMDQLLVACIGTTKSMQQSKLKSMLAAHPADLPVPMPAVPPQVLTPILQLPVLHLLPMLHLLLMLL